MGVQWILLEDHTALRCEVVVVCAGIRPNADLARAGGLAVNRGVLVDDTMATSAPDVLGPARPEQGRGIVAVAVETEERDRGGSDG